jgi:triosephosphate isomerase
MYLGHAHTLEWAGEVARIASSHTATRTGLATLFVAPTFPALVPVCDVLAGSGVALAAQNMFWQDRGPFTGEVSGRELADIGCSIVEIGHAERRALFAEDDAIVSLKVAAAYRNGLMPLICVGEPEQAPPSVAAHEVISQLEAAFSVVDAEGGGGRVLVAYEPQWAIGRAEPAEPDYVSQVVSEIRRWLDSRRAERGSAVLYGGSAGPGLLTALVERTDGVGGLFLGRFAHDPVAVADVLDEVVELNRH